MLNYSLQAGTQKIWFGGHTFSAVFLATIFFINVTIVLSLATVAGVDGAWYLLFFFVFLLVVILAAGCGHLIDTEKKKKVNKIDVEVAEKVEAKDPLKKYFNENLKNHVLVSKEWIN